MSYRKKLQRYAVQSTGGYLANWRVDNPVEIGDIGRFDGFKFSKEDNLANRFSGLTINEDLIDIIQSYEGGSALMVDNKVAGKIDGVTDSVLQSADVKFKFSGEGAFYFLLSKIRNISYDRKMKVFEALHHLIFSGELRWFPDDYVLITAVKEAEKGSLIVTHKSTKDVALSGEAKTDLFTKVGAKFDLSASESGTYTDQFTKWASVFYKPTRFIYAKPASGNWITTSLSDWLKQLKRSLGRHPEIEEIKLKEYEVNNGQLEIIFEFPEGGSLKMIEVDVAQEVFDDEFPGSALLDDSDGEIELPLEIVEVETAEDEPVESIITVSVAQPVEASESEEEEVNEPYLHKMESE